ncbi:MAG: DUF4175 domain-containing protein [Acidobacteria bacterium]|nr:DUF4175 domain-containing protein [Acidobacteriota bacterium]
MKNNTNGRLLAQTCACRPYQDNYDEVMKICEETGRKPAEVLRDALDEWLLMRHRATTGSDTSPPSEQQNDREVMFEELQQDIRRLDKRLEELARNIEYAQKREHGYLLEIFLVTYGARDLIWKTISTRMLQDKQTPESIQIQFEAFEQEWNVKTNALEDMIREYIRKGSSNVET